MIGRRALLAVGHVLLLGLLVGLVLGALVQVVGVMP
jgi:hypothetical protein